MKEGKHPRIVDRGITSTQNTTMANKTQEESKEGFVLTAIEPAWVEQQYRVTPDSIEPITEPITGDVIDDMSQQSTYELDNGTELDSWGEVQQFSELLGGTEEQIDQFLQAIGEETNGSELTCK